MKKRNRKIRELAAVQASIFRAVFSQSFLISPSTPSSLLHSRFNKFSAKSYFNPQFIEQRAPKKFLTAQLHFDLAIFTACCSARNFLVEALSQGRGRLGGTADLAVLLEKWPSRD